MQRLMTAIRWLNIGSATLASAMMVLMMLHITLDVANRYFFNGQIVGTLEVVSFYYMVALVFLAFGFVELKHENIRVDLFAQMMPRPVQFALYLLACVLGLIFFGMLFWQTLHDAIRATGSGEEAMSNFRFIIWPSRWSLPIGFAAAFLAVMANLLTSVSQRKAL
ncbi:TRAP transporter small permease [Salipiger sp. HF18]|uniref:TRAP transporter small permease subunit n=1 Tax=Salipiger sp. HF18 TaxID=2721557 RepID=UPI000C520CD6|nr:TRAP transporter small permease [Salipiger sp. HF18]MAU46951.1 C4-dicarboxylate ABC transporter permease [Salipiger sp.]NIY94916.1 TRAP transporter small permease [Salipiger sp. HF18]